MEKKISRREAYNETMSYLPPLLYMGIKGVRRDEEWHERLKDDYAIEIKERHTSFCKSIGRWLNIQSGPQVATFLTKDLQLRIKSRTAGGRISTDVDTLKEIRRMAPEKSQRAIDEIITLKQMYKMYSTYINFDEDLWDGRIRCSYNLAGTETWRISSSQSSYESMHSYSSGMNLQNQPSRMDPEKKIRRMFIPDEGMEMVKIDLAKAEVYVVAYLSGDEHTISLLKTAESDPSLDIHKVNASLIFNKENGAITYRERQLGKMAKHAVNYGMTYKGLIQNCLKEDIYLSAREAKDIIEKSKKASPLLEPWHESIRKQLQRNRYLDTPLGKRRWFGGPVNGEGSEGTYREAYAFIPQSTVGQLTLRGMRRLFDGGCDILLEVHDEVVLQSKDVHELPKLKRLMEETLPITDMFGVTREMTIPADVEVGRSWGETEEVQL